MNPEASQEKNSEVLELLPEEFAALMETSPDPKVDPMRAPGIIDFMKEKGISLNSGFIKIRVGDKQAWLDTDKDNWGTVYPEFPDSEEAKKKGYKPAENFYTLLK